MNYLLGDIKRKTNFGSVLCIYTYTPLVFIFVSSSFDYLMNVHFIAGNIAILVSLCQSFIVRRPVICFDCKVTFTFATFVIFYTLAYKEEIHF